MADCLGEAQIIAKIKSSEVTQDNGRCIVKIDLSQVSFFQESMVCPLYLEDIAEKGIDMSDRTSTCNFQKGEAISGIVELTADGRIKL